MKQSIQNRKWIVIGLMGMLAVGLGAFGAHGLKNSLDAYHIEIFKTGVFYHFIHTLAMAIVALLSQTNNSKWLDRSYYGFMLGVILFSGSLYLLAIQPLLPLNTQWLGPITPIGGLFLIAAWFFLSLSHQKNSPLE